MGTILTLYKYYYIIAPVGDIMFHLVVAKGKNCEKCAIIKSGTYEELSSYTTKFNTSDDVRLNNKKAISKFMYDNNCNGDIVIMDDTKNNARVKVLYKSHVKIVKELIKSQNLMKYLVSNNILLVSTYDYIAIMHYKKTQYQKHMKNFLVEKRKYYYTIKTILKGYEQYQKQHKELPSIHVMQKEIMNKNKKTNSENHVIYNLNSDIKNEEYYNIVNTAMNNGGYEEVFNDYSLDELGSNLNEDDFKVLVKSGYHR